jgi:hypothetical protein
MAVLVVRGNKVVVVDAAAKVPLAIPRAVVGAEGQAAMVGRQETRARFLFM